MEKLNLYDNSHKFIICQPLGGINDMLCQISHCIIYAERFNRKLIIDTKMASDLCDHFGNYFHVIKPNNFIYTRLDAEDIAAIQVQAPTLDIIHSTMKSNLYPLVMSADSNEKFLLHRAFGGGTESLNALKYFKLLPHITNAIRHRKRCLGNYNAVLIRNTDYQTDYQTELANIYATDSDSPLYVFTDDYNVQDYAKTLGFLNLIVNENLYKNKEEHLKFLPIMQTSQVFPAIPASEINFQVLSDLFLAALSKRIYPTYIVGHRGDRQFENKQVRSGFVNLAIGLNRDKILLDTILQNW